MHQTAGLTGLRNVQHNFVFSDPTLMWSHSAVQGNVITAASGTILGINILYKYITPDPTMRIPINYNLSHYELTQYDTQFTSPINSGSTNQLLASNNFQLTAIPRRLIIWAGQPESTKLAPYTYINSTPAGGMIYPDSYFFISKLQILFNNTLYLGTATPVDLWKMSVKNGLNMSWAQWSQFRGSIVVIDMGLDIGLHADQAPGLAGNFQLMIQANVANLSPNNVAQPTLYCWASYEGQMNVLGGNVTHQLGVLSKQDVLNSRFVDGINFKSERHVYGGSLWGDIWHGIKKAANFIKDNKLISRIASGIKHPYAQAIAEGARKIGLGLTGGDDLYGDGPVGGVYSGGDYSGGVLVEGGRRHKKKKASKMKGGKKRRGSKKMKKGGKRHKKRSKKMKGGKKRRASKKMSRLLDMVDKKMKGGKRRKGSKKGSKKMKGGAMMSKSALMKRLQC